MRVPLYRQGWWNGMDGGKDGKLGPEEKQVHVALEWLVSRHEAAHLRVHVGHQGGSNSTPGAAPQGRLLCRPTAPGLCRPGMALSLPQARAALA